MTLTEEWKKGELPEGYYYVKDGENMIAEYIDGYFYNDGLPMTSFSGGVDKVLAKVPTYSEYLALQSDSLAKNEGAEIVAELKKIVKDLKAEKSVLLTENRILNEQLKEVCKKHISLKLTEGACDDVNKILHEQIKEFKELLKECEHIMSIEKDFASCHFEKDKLCKLLTKIKQALGEDK